MWLGSAPSEAAATASDTSEKALDQVQSVADPGNVEEALDSVGDAVENAVPDPKGAPSGLAPTSPVSNSLAPDAKAEGTTGFVCAIFSDEKAQGMMHALYDALLFSLVKHVLQRMLRFAKIAWQG